MKAEFICHKDFSTVQPINVFHKECEKKELDEKDDINAGAVHHSVGYRHSAGQHQPVYRNAPSV